jgi:hypothetical protein
MPNVIGRTEIKAFTQPWLRGVEIYAMKDDTFASDVTWTDFPNDGRYIPPLFHVDFAACQALMDSLYTMGVRPSGAAGSAGQRESLEKHLEDMRTLAFNTLEIEKP